MVPIAWVIAGHDWSALTGVGLWVVGLLGAMTVFAVAIYILRGKLLTWSDEKSESGFTMKQIDRLHDEGVLTDEEYRLARRNAMGLTGSDAFGE